MRIKHYRGNAERMLAQLALNLQVMEHYSWTEGLVDCLNSTLKIKLTDRYGYIIADEAIVQAEIQENVN